MSASLSEGSSATATASMPVGPRPGAPAWQDRAGVVGLVLLLLLLGVRYVITVRPRAMEFDQICTLLTAKALTWHAYVAAVPADSQPPFSHIAARAGLLLPLREAIGVHVVSAAAIAVTAICLFLLFRRRGATLAGLCCAALFAASRCVEYMYTIRPYAALMAVTALGLLMYDTYRQRRAAGERATLWPLTLTIVLAATIHALSLVYVLLPIAAGEVLYWIRSRRIDQRLVLGAGLAATAFGFDFTLAHQIKTRYMSMVPMSARIPGLPTAAKLIEVLTIPAERHWQGLLLVVAIGATIALQRWRPSLEQKADGRGGDLLFPLLAGLALYVAAVLAFCMGATNHYFFTRYASPVYLSGPLLVGAAFAAAPWRRFSAVPLGIAAVLLLLPLQMLRTFLKSQSGATPGEENAALFAHGEVIASPLAFPTIWWYATPQQRSQMRMLTDPALYRTIPDGIPEVVLQRFAAAGVLPFPLTQYRDFRPGRDVYLVSPRLSGDTWVPAALEARGFTCAADESVRSETYALTHCVKDATSANR